MLRADDFRAEFLRDDVGELQHALGLLGERQGEVGVRVGVGGSHRGFELFRENLHVEVEVLEHLDGNAAAFLQHAQKKVLQTHVCVAKAFRFLVTE